MCVCIHTYIRYIYIRVFPYTMQNFKIIFFFPTNPAFDDGSYRDSVAKIL